MTARQRTALILIGVAFWLWLWVFALSGNVGS